MNTKVLYVAGISLLMIGIVFYFIDSGFFTFEKPFFSSYYNSIDSSVKPTSASASSTFVNDDANTSTVTPTNIDKSIVKPTSYQLPKSFPYSKIGDFDKQIILNLSKLNQAQLPSSFSSIPFIAFAQSPNKNSPSNLENLTVSIKSVNIVPENNSKSLQIALNVHNPNRGSAILETLNYNVYLNNVRLASADIGTKPEGFIDSLSSVYPIIGNQTITLKDKQPLTPEGSSLLNSSAVLINGSKSNTSKSQNPSTSFYTVNGTFSTTLARGTESQSSETPYNLKFPAK